VAGGAPAPAAAADGGLVLLAVDRLYGGGGTARFDPGFRSVQPKAEALFHPADAAALGLNAGDTVTLQTAGGALSLPVRISAAVVPGTVQVPWGAPDGAVNSLLEGALWAKVHVRKRVLEEVG